MTNERKIKLTVTESELQALIQHHAAKFMSYDDKSFTTDISSRIHDLTKRLNKKDEVDTSDAPEVEGWN